MPRATNAYVLSLARSRALRTAAILAATLVLAGCLQAEDGRPLVYEPGVYLGAEDEALDAETQTELRRRSDLQNF